MLAVPPAHAGKAKLYYLGLQRGRPDADGVRVVTVGVWVSEVGGCWRGGAG